MSLNKALRKTVPFFDYFIIRERKTANDFAVIYAPFQAFRDQSSSRLTSVLCGGLSCLRLKRRHFLAEHVCVDFETWRTRRTDAI